MEDPMNNQLKLDHAAAFVLAGNAVVTVARPVRYIKRQGVEVEDPERRFTYKVSRARGEETARPWFVKVLTGQNNVEDYQYLGTIFPDGDGIIYRHGRKSTIGEDAPSAKGIAWLVRNLDGLIEAKREVAKADPLFGNPAAESKLQQVEASLNRMEYYHMGHCGRCNRALTVPESILNGIGPECAKKVGDLNVLDLLARNL
jgi:hypothetical protein